MFERIKEIISGKSQIKQAYDQAFATIDLVTRLFDEATAHLMEGKQPTLDIHKEDKQINVTEIKIRRAILEHLTVDPGTELSASLILYAVMGYVERIGDYAKNIEELAHMHKEPLCNSVVGSELRELTEQVRRNLAMTREAFRDEDKAKALEAIRENKITRKRCDKIFEQVFQAENVDKHEALICAMYARYLKRISAGLKNVCTTVTVPFDHIGYTKLVHGPE